MELSCFPHNATSLPMHDWLAFAPRNPRSTLTVRPCPSASLCFCLQHDNGAQVVQIFDSWAAQLSPMDFDIWCGPYIKYIIAESKKVRPAGSPDQGGPGGGGGGGRRPAHG